jgi:hypothetical protein
MINQSQIDEINFNSNNSPLRSKIFDPFHGGRALGAIYGLDDINVYETAILLFIGNKHVFHEEDRILARVSRKEICKATKISLPTFCRSVKSLIDKNYLYISNNYDNNGLQVENTYYITDYLFIKYAASRGVNLREYQAETPGVSHREIYNTSVAIPSFDVDSLEAERSEEKENKNNNIELKYCGSGAEGEPLSLCQSCRNFEKIEDSGYPSDRSAHKLEEVDLGNFEDIQKKKISAKDQFEAKISQVAIDHPEYIPLKVTSSHRKMIAIFRITDPKVKKKSWVKDNDIHFFTDQVFDKYGDIAHNIIDVLYKDMKDTGKCGQIAWDINTAFKRVEIAYSRYLKMKDRKND